MSKQDCKKEPAMSPNVVLKKKFAQDLEALIAKNLPSDASGEVTREVACNALGGYCRFVILDETMAVEKEEQALLGLDKSVCFKTIIAAQCESFYYEFVLYFSEETLDSMILKKHHSYILGVNPIWAEGRSIESGKLLLIDKPMYLSDYSYSEEQKEFSSHSYYKKYNYCARLFAEDDLYAIVLCDGFSASSATTIEGAIEEMQVNIEMMLEFTEKHDGETPKTTSREELAKHQAKGDAPIIEITRPFMFNQNGLLAFLQAHQDKGDTSSDDEAEEIF